MALIGRKKERDRFLGWLCSGTSELICVYGRRRIGKTFFVNELLQEYYAFDASALDAGNEKQQLRAFNEALLDYGCENRHPPADWWDAFRRLRELLDSPDCIRTPEGKRVVFLDEFPWFDTARSGFIDAFSDFWNRWAQRRSDVKVIICGSATSWILREVLQTEGSLNRRVTQSLYLAPFTLKETEEFLRTEKEIDWGRREIIECYMVFGGVPYYLRRLQGRLSLGQNITALCLLPQAPLKDEAKRLLDSTLSNKPLYYRVLAALGKRKEGFARKELVDMLSVNDGSGFSMVLMGLEECGYIRTYENPYRRGRKTIYQLIDPFLLFSMRFVGSEKPLKDWLAYYDTPSYNAWRGIAFEIVCLNHLPQIRRALSLETMQTVEFPWRSNGSKPGAQIDLVIERPDKITYVCEMKFTNASYSISASYCEKLLQKMSVFKSESKTKSSVQVVIVAAAGFTRNANASAVAQVVEGDDLFA